MNYKGDKNPQQWRGDRGWVMWCRSSGRAASEDVQRKTSKSCYQLAVFREPETAAVRTLINCEGGRRVIHAYLSESSVVDIEFLVSRNQLKSQLYFLLQFTGDILSFVYFVSHFSYPTDERQKVSTEPARLTVLQVGGHHRWATAETRIGEQAHMPTMHVNTEALAGRDNTCRWLSAATGASGDWVLTSSFNRPAVVIHSLIWNVILSVTTIYL